MIERKFVAEKRREFLIEEHIKQSLKNVGFSHAKLQRTPIGEKIVIFTSRPGLIVGKGGQNIKILTKNLKRKFNLENPQIAISEVENPNLDANIVSERIADTMERYGTSKFKGIVHKVMTDVIKAGARGIEIVVSGKVPSARAKSWRFYVGYLKKCGDVAVSQVKIAYAAAQLKSGTVGIKVSIMPPDVVLPDNIKVMEINVDNDTEKKDSNISTEIQSSEGDKHENKEQGTQSAEIRGTEQQVE